MGNVFLLRGEFVLSVSAAGHAFPFQHAAEMAFCVRDLVEPLAVGSSNIEGLFHVKHGFFCLVLACYEGNDELGGARHIPQVNGLFGAMHVVHADPYYGGLQSFAVEDVCVATAASTFVADFSL